MKKITTFLLLAGVSGLLSAGDLQLNDKGYFELDGWRATPTTYSESWQALQPTTSREVFKKIDSESGVLFQMNFAGDVSGKLALALENEENATASVSRWMLTKARNSKPTAKSVISQKNSARP